MTKTAARDNSGKLMYSSCHPLVAETLGYDLVLLKAFCSVGTMGSYKYDIPNGTRLNYMLGGKPALEYIDCMSRHMAAHLSGEIVDPESKLPHVFHALWNAAVLVTFTEHNLCEPVFVPEHLTRIGLEPVNAADLDQALFRAIHRLSFCHYHQDFIDLSRSVLDAISAIVWDLAARPADTVPAPSAEGAPT